MNIADIQMLRKETGASLVDCRNALTASHGDVQQAMESLFEKGIRLVEKKSERVAADGIAFAKVFGDRAVLLEVNTETDFVAGNETFKDQVETIAQAIAEAQTPDLKGLKGVRLPRQEMTVGDLLQKMILTFGEKIVIRRFEVLKGSKLFAYMHQNGKIGVIFGLDVTGQDNPLLKQQIAKEIALQIASMSPQFVSRDRLDQAEIESIRQQIETELSTDETLKGKPAAVRERIASGRFEKYFKTHALLEQDSIRDDSLTVRQFIDSLIGQHQMEIDVTGFHRYEKAEGIEAEPVLCPLFNNPF